MNIKEAIDKAMPLGKSITRKLWEKEHRSLYIIPTNTTSGMILNNPREKSIEYKLCPGWQPEAQDLQADDWVMRG